MPNFAKNNKHRMYVDIHPIILTLANGTKRCEREKNVFRSQTQINRLYG